MLERSVTSVRAAVSPDATFEVGLRLSECAASEFIRDRHARDALKTLLAREGLCVSTINGFPFGAFHGEPVKQRVYLPDWRSAERRSYTTQLAELLVELLVDTDTGSISTVPGAFRADAETPDALERIAESLLDVAHEFALLEASTGKTLVLALEPEPGCLLETTDDAIQFFESQLLSPRALHRLRTRGCPAGREEDLVRRHLGVCLDTCHAAVEFEPALEAYERYVAAGIAVPKVQVSAGLVVDAADPDQLRALREFDEPVYLHQVVMRREGVLQRFDDLPLAFAAGPPSRGEQWRVHFHVPLFTDDYGAFASTRSEILPLLQALRTRVPCPLLEVETYTWDVLPERFRTTDVCAAIARELTWVRSQLEGA